jgi:tetratricopeptide (TPR) repeat protein
MLTTCSVIVLISPHEGEASAGVQTEIAELKSCNSPVILLHWSPKGWDPLLDPPQIAGVNIIWHYEGSTSGDRGVAENACAHIARQLAIASWLACNIRWAQGEHPRTAGCMLAMIPEGPYDPLLNFRLERPEVERTEWQDSPDPDMLAATIAGEAPEEDLRAYVHAWRAGSDLLAAELARNAQFSLKRPVQTLNAACEALCWHACHRQPALLQLPSDTLRGRGLMLVRLDRSDEALPLLQQALLTAPHDALYELHQAMAFAWEGVDPQGAIASLTRAIDCAPLLETACVLTYHRGALRSKLPAERTVAIADFSFVAKRSADVAIRHDAFRARARLHAANQDHDAAIADYTEILQDPDATPRSAVSAWMDRGALYRMLGRNDDAIADWTRAIDAADAEPLQRFRTLEARAQLLEKLGRHEPAAADYEAMTKFSSVGEEYRAELAQTAARLHG